MAPKKKGGSSQQGRRSHKTEEAVRAALEEREGLSEAFSNMGTEGKEAFALRMSQNMGMTGMADRLKRSMEAQKRAEEARMKICFEAMLNLGRPAKVELDDGDQSQLSGHDAGYHKYLWASGLDWNPDSPSASSWQRLLAAGDIDRLEKVLVNTPQDKMAELLEHRETALRFSAVLHVVKGAMMLEGDGERFGRDMSFVDHSKEPRHLECLARLIGCGANIEARDFLGYTALFYCVTKFGNSTTLKLAKVLLRHGADVNARSRIGSTPLSEPVIGGDARFVKFLLDNGADPTIRDNDGMSAQTNVNSPASTKENLRLFADARKKRSKEMRAKERELQGGNLKRCQTCGEDNSSRCTGCYLVFYCGGDCQKADWPNHKGDCRKAKEEYMYVNIRPVEGCNVGHRKGDIQDVSKASKPAKKTFIVKVQIPFDSPVEEMMAKDLEKDRKKVLIVYDKEKYLYGMIEQEEAVYDLLVEKIKAGGVFGDKGFFYALADKKNRIKINPCRMLPPETW